MEVGNIGIHKILEKAWTHEIGIKTHFHRNKPPIKTKKSRTDAVERPLSVEAREDEDCISEKALTPENTWKKVITDIDKKNDWEKQFKA